MAVDTELSNTAKRNKAQESDLSWDNLATYQLCGLGNVSAGYHPLYPAISANSAASFKLSLEYACFFSSHLPIY